MQVYRASRLRTPGGWVDGAFAVERGRVLRDLLALRGTVAQDERAAEARAARDAMLARGTAAVGDVCNEAWIASVWAERPLPGVLFHELLGLDDDGAALDRAVEATAALPAPAGRGLFFELRVESFRRPPRYGRWPDRP